MSLEYSVLSDPNGETAESYNLVFKLPDNLIETYQQLGFNLPEYNGNDSWELPVPATFIISQSGKIRFAFVDPDYSKRAEPSEVVEVLQELV